LAVKEITPRGFRIVYDVDGSGPTVLLLAGLTMWRQQWVDAGYVARLADEFQLIRVDPLGHGDSAKPHDPALYHSAEVASDLVSVLDEEAVRTAILWGFSAGAQTALGAASIAPGRVAAVICGSGGWRNEPVAEAAWCQPIVELLRSPRGLERFWAAGGFTDAEAVERALAHNDAAAVAAVLEGSTGWRPDYDQLRMPILSYRGDHEDLDHNDRLMARLGAAVHILPNAGHLDCFSRIDTVLDVVHPFIRHHAPPH
jgi:pimeloyl-ACP methyl ester carboxylesterase